MKYNHFSLKRKNANKAYISYFIFTGILCILPIISYYNNDIISSGTISTLGNVAIYAIAALGLNLLLGYSGLVSLGTAAFMGLGSYFAAYFTKDLALPFFLSLALSVLIPTIIGLVVGLISLRIEGYYLAIATLAVAEVFRKMFDNISFFNGAKGRSADNPQLFFGLIKVSNRIFHFNSMFIFIVIILGIIMILTFNIIHSKIGRAFLALRGSEAAAQAMGINLLKYKLEAFALTTAYAALAGVLYVHKLTFTNSSNWTMNISLIVLAIIVIGGMRSIYGTIIGAFVMYGSSIFLGFMKNNDLVYILSGVLIIVIILFYPNGLVHIFHDIKRLYHYLRNATKKEKGVNNE